MHPESATWTDLRNNLFNFETKVNEFVRAGTCAQFGPDGLARAVLFNKGLTKFVSKKLYRIFWEGGYQNPLGPVAP
jgi:GH24 family phage-related lysozyme (muramidase)